MILVPGLKKLVKVMIVTTATTVITVITTITDAAEVLEEAATDIVRHLASPQVPVALRRRTLKRAVKEEAAGTSRQLHRLLRLWLLLQ